MTDEISTLDDRAKDNWCMMMRIAALAGGDWPERALRAARVTSGQPDSDKHSEGVRLLADIKRAFDDMGSDTIPSDPLATRLRAMEDASWGDAAGGKGLSTRGIAKLLKPFGISPRKGKDANYYQRSDFTDAWERYL